MNHEIAYIRQAYKKTHFLTGHYCINFWSSASSSDATFLHSNVTAWYNRLLEVLYFIFIKNLLFLLSVTIKNTSSVNDAVWSCRTQNVQFLGALWFFSVYIVKDCRAYTLFYIVLCCLVLCLVLCMCFSFMCCIWFVIIMKKRSARR